jgi:hypothetical protein
MPFRVKEPHRLRDIDVETADGLQVLMQNNGFDRIQNLLDDTE